MRARKTWEEGLSPKTRKTTFTAGTGPLWSGLLVEGETLGSVPFSSRSGQVRVKKAGVDS